MYILFHFFFLYWNVLYILLCVITFFEILKTFLSGGILMSYYNFLISHYRMSPLYKGDVNAFIDRINKDPNFPKKAMTYTEVYYYLLYNKAHPSFFECFFMTWDAYEAFAVRNCCWIRIFLKEPHLCAVFFL